MIKPIEFLNALKKAKIQFVTGVPDSLLKEICACIDKIFSKKNHIIATNEGSAVAMEIGHYLASKNPAVVYMQNSGMGNSINPTTSLADPKVYGIPIIFLIGWRGELLKNGKQLKDEPQHIKQGKITLEQLKILKIPYKIISSKTKNIKLIIKKFKKLALKRSGPVALVFRKKTFLPFKNFEKNKGFNLISRENAINEIIKKLNKNVIVVSTTGMASRELFELRKLKKQSNIADFLTVGGMGHVGQIATGIALKKPNKKILCIDGDGSILMHMGSLAINAQCSNLTHVILNNECHDSVGGQPTKGNVVNFASIAKSCGYKNTKIIKKNENINRIIKKQIYKKGSSLIVVKCKKGSRPNLGRPNQNLFKRKREFMNLIK